MSREILPRDDSEGNSREIMPRTRIGLLLTEAEATARVNTLNSDIYIVDQAVDADIKVMKSHLPNLSEEEKKRVAWLPGWTNFKLDYNSFLSQGLVAADEPTLYNFELRFRQLRKSYEELAGSVKPSAPVSPDPPKPTDFFKGAGEGLHSIETIVRWGAIGALGYVGYRLFASSGPSRAVSEPKPKASYDHEKVVEEATRKTEAAVKG